jgi:transcriptional regulator with XRE-family HTH domain
MTLNRDDQIADLVSARALNPDLTRPRWATPQEWEDIGHLAVIERELRAGAVAPPLADDRTAAMLGLLPDPNLRLDPAALRRTRQRAGLNADDLATQLSDRGWEITAGQVFHWENRDTAEVPPALIEAIAAVFHIEVARLVAGVGTTYSTKDLIAEYLLDSGISLSIATGWEKV